MGKKIPSTNLYELLEVSPRARPEVINAAYRTLMKEYHPDHNEHNKDTTRDFGAIARDLNEAKDVLLDPKKREEYDSSCHTVEGKVIGNYRFLEKIAEGGFGPTYKGEHLVSGLPVCIKHGHFVSPQDEKVLREEAEAIWDLRHYGIPVMRDMFKIEGQGLALVMSYIPGPTLEKVVNKAGGKLDSEHVAWITERTLNILMYLHCNGVVHGDVKPQNIIIQPKNHELVLVDYGLSAIRPAHDSKSKGYTPLFSPPEQLNGLPLLPASDFYNLGITMIYALGGDIEKKLVPESTPNLLCHFIRSLIVRDVLSRPDWQKENVFENFKEIRKKAFGRSRSNLKPLPGL